MNDQNSPGRWLAVIAVGITVSLSALDGTIVAIALPSIGAAFHLSNQLASAIVLGYAIPLTLLILPAGALVS